MARLIIILSALRLGFLCYILDLRNVKAIIVENFYLSELTQAPRCYAMS